MLGPDSRGVCVLRGVNGSLLALFKIWLMKRPPVLYFIFVFRYDEWIKADKIVHPANKNVPKIKHRKKIKVRRHRVLMFPLVTNFLSHAGVIDSAKFWQNKNEKEQDQLERLGDREAAESPSNSNRAPRSKCGLSQDVFSKMDSGELRGTQLSPAKAIEITSILNGLQGSSPGL